MSETDLAYVAGIIDGEGYVGIKKDMGVVRRGHSKSPMYHERIQIRMTNENAVKFVAFVLNVPYCKEKRYISCKSGKPLYCISISDKKAYEALKKVFAHLKVKKEQTEIIFKLRQSKNNPEARKRGNRGGRRKGKGQTMPQHILDEREQLWLEVKKLNE